MKQILFGAFLAVASTMSQASTPSESVEHFLQQVTTPQSDQAYDRIFAGSGLAEQKPQELVTLKSKSKMAMGLYGTPIGIEKVGEDDLSPSVKRLVYIQKFEGYPVFWEFYFYKPHEKWQLNSLNFKDQIPSMWGAGR